jgi:glyoxylase-like metal-dependent hydrolase (beta-lactamase superfamily II)
MVHPLTHCGVVRAYIVAGQDGIMVIDIGSIGTAEDVASYIEARNDMSLGDVKYIVATHFHIDHIGGIGHFLRKCPVETKVLFSHHVKDYLSKARKLCLIKNWFVALTPASVLSARYVRRFSHLWMESLAGIPLPGFRNLVKLPYGKDRIDFFGDAGLKRSPLGFDEWEFIETPGHTEDSVSFYNAASGELICGDLIINMAKNGCGRLNRFHWSKDVILKTYHDLCRTIVPEAVYPGHGEIIKDKNALLNVEAF